MNKKKNVALLLLFVNYCSFTQTKSNNTNSNFTKVLKHYAKENNPEKSKAALFLINNMSIHKSVDYKWFNKNGTIIPFSEFDFSDYKTAYKYLFNLKDSISLKPKKITTYDSELITLELLIRNIDTAYLKWKQNPWSQNYTFETFCEYILPYRSLMEPLEDWREDYARLASRKTFRLEDQTDPVDVCTQVISSLDDFTFINKRSDPIPILSPKQMLFRKQGSCPDLANFSVYVCRSVGLAVTFDFTPQYAASSNRHFWNTIINKDGKHIPFNSNAVNESEESLPYIYNANKKRLGKVYRKTFSIQENSLANSISVDNIPKGFLREQNNLDVTAEYVEVSNLIIDSKKFTDSLGYLNVFNLGKWKVIDWGKKDNDQMIFKNLGRDIVYLPSTFHSKRMTYQKYPYLINKKGMIKELIPNQKKSISVVLSRTNEQISNYIDFNTLEIIGKKTYRLSIWENGWKFLGSSIASNRSLKFNSIATGGLYQLLPENPDGFERVFTFDAETHKIVWY